MVRHSALYNGGRPGKRSGPGAGFVNRVELVDTPDEEVINKVKRFVASSSTDAVECALFLEMLGIEP